MTQIMIFSFPYGGPWDAEMTEATTELAREIASEPDLICKAWLENAQARKAGGIYFFKTEEAAQRYRCKHQQRLTAMGYADIEIQCFTLNSSLSGLTGLSEALLLQRVPA